MRYIEIDKIEGYPFIYELLSILDDRWEEIYLVGGAVRDYFLDRPSYDLDFVVPWREDILARRFANKIKGKFFLLGDREKVARVILSTHEKIWKFDFTAFRGKDIYDDLEKRDFTINSLALSLRNFTLIDIFDGLNDIRKKILNPVTVLIFKNDPLRILRAFRLSYSLSFSISDRLYDLINQYKILLSSVSGERIRDEFFGILKTSNFQNAILELYNRKILDIILPGIIYDFELLKRYKKLIEEGLDSRFYRYKRELVYYLNKKVSFERKKEDLLKLSLLLLFLQEDKYIEYLKRLKLSKSEIRSIKDVIVNTKRFLKEGYPSLDELYLLSSHAQNELPGVALLLYLFDKMSLAHYILDLFYKKLLPGRDLPKLIDGDLLQNRWGVNKGPKIKDILDKIRIAQIRGEINSKEDAYKFVDNYIKAFDL